MSEYAKGIAVIVIALLGLGFGVKTLHGKKRGLNEEAKKIRNEIEISDKLTQKLTRNVNKRVESMKRVESFYRSWVPHVHRCQNASELLSNLLRVANQHDLIPFKKETKTDAAYQFEGQERTVDTLELTLGGRYEDLIRFLDEVRVEYPFLSEQQLGFTVAKSSITMTVHLSLLRMDLPEEEIAMLTNESSP